MARTCVFGFAFATFVSAAVELILVIQVWNDDVMSRPFFSFRDEDLMENCVEAWERLSAVRELTFQIHRLIIVTLWLCVSLLSTLFAFLVYRHEKNAGQVP